MSRNPKLIDKWLTSLPRDARRAISGIVATADASNTPLYLVGGPLRDLLLNRPSLDIDLVVEADAIEFARRAAHYLDAAVKTHPTFGTATVILRHEGSGAEGSRPRTSTTPRPARPEALVGRADHGRSEHPSTLTIDIATTRTETYPRPGALPHVATPATIEQDLHRRDFTINALALCLNGPDRGEIIDPTNGHADLEARLIRILHARSFQDDPTRILRAVRYAARLGFPIDRTTLNRLKRDAPHLQRVSATRLHHEFALIFEEPSPEATLRHLDHLGVLASIHLALHFERPECTTFQRLRTLTSNVAAPVRRGGAPSGPPAAVRAACWPAIALRLSPSDATSLAARLALTNPQRAAVEAIPRLRELLLPAPAAQSLPSPAHGSEARGEGSDGIEQPTTPRPARPEVLVGRADHGRPEAEVPRSAPTRSALADLLGPIPLPSILAVTAFTTDRALRTRLLDYLTTARHIRPILRGDDLVALGVPEGPAVGDILRRLRAAKLNGEVKTKTDEIRLLQTIVKVGDLKGDMVVGQRTSLRGKHGAGL